MFLHIYTHITYHIHTHKLAADGTLQSKGLVNSREHLESLVEAMDSGVASLQDYVAQLESEHDAAVKEQAS